LAVHALCKDYPLADGGVLPVLRDLTFSVPAGSIISIIGPSGCGKSTLLRILAGVDSSFEGGVGPSRADCLIGYMQQEEALLPWRDVLRNTTLGLELIGQSFEQAAEAARSMLSLVGLGRWSKRYPAELSGGMRRRVQLARTLVLPSSLVLLDEPLVHLDIEAKTQLASIIRRSVTERHSVGILVTHSIEEVLSVADECIVLTSRPAEIFARIALKRRPESGALPDGSTGYLFQQIATALHEATLK
jgi:NitT/TauT family transport system ATP-binding protein